MKISILTMFPELFGSYLQSPIPKRAVDRKISDIRIIDIKQYAGGSFRHIDDDTYGGGAGAVLRAGPVLAALQAALGNKAPNTTLSPDTIQSYAEDSQPVRSISRNSVPTEHPDSRNSAKGQVIAALTPVGRLYDQQTAERYSHLDHLILICGHYEGLDERIYHHVDERISIGDYILSGGELASQIVTDSILRLLPGVLRAASTADESFCSVRSASCAPLLQEASSQQNGSIFPDTNSSVGLNSASPDKGLLEYPQYTRPANLDGDKVPDVLLSGDHEAIRRWRLKESLSATLKWRPDLLAAHHLTEEEANLLTDIRKASGT